MFSGNGKLKYHDNWWLVVNVEGDICKYYRTLVNFYDRSLQLNSPKHNAHITVIAGKYERPKYEHLWNKYQDETIYFEYTPEITIDREYFWMEVKCKRIEDIREELGLTPKIIQPWHLTVGNII